MLSTLMLSTLGNPTAMQPEQVFALSAETRCSIDMSSCSGGANRFVALAAHKAAMYDTHHTNTMPECAQYDTPKVFSAYEASVPLPFVGALNIGINVTEGHTAKLDMSGAWERSCHVEFRRSAANGQAFTLNHLSQQCRVPHSVRVKQLKYCASKDEVHALVGTPFADVAVVAKATDDGSRREIDARDVPKSVSAQDLNCSYFNIPEDCYGDTNPHPGEMTDEQYEICKQGLCGGAVHSHTPHSHSTSHTHSPASENHFHSPSDSGGSCFDKATATACMLADASVSLPAAFADCYGSGPASGAASLVKMAGLEAGDRVLTVTADGDLAATPVLVNQHQHSDDVSPLLTLHTDTGAQLTLTPDHALWVNGRLAPAADAVVGAVLRAPNGGRTVVTRVTQSVGAVINPVTQSATLLASSRGLPPVVATSHPIWIAQYLVSSPASRAAVNAALVFAGDGVTDAVSFAAAVVPKLVAAVAAAALLVKALFPPRAPQPKLRVA